MGKNRLERLLKLRDILEDAYVRVTQEIKREQLADAIITLANNEGVMLLLNRQNLQNNVEVC